MKLILSASSHHDNDDGGCALALVDMTPRLAQLALRRIETLRTIKAQDENVEEIYCWNYDAVFFDPFIGVEGDQEGIPEGRKALAGEELLESLDNSPNDFIEVDDAFEIPERQIARLDCCQMAVRNEGIAFVAIPRHVGFYVETCGLPIEVLRRAADSS